MSTFEIIARTIIAQASLQHFGVTCEHVLPWLVSRYLDVIGNVPFGEATRQTVAPANSIAQYTEGTVSVTQGSTTVTGVGTTFTVAMSGRKIRIGTSRLWYGIAFTTATALTLDAPWVEEALAGVNYTIVQRYIGCPVDVRWLAHVIVPQAQGLVEINIEELNANYPDRSMTPGLPQRWARSHYTPAPPFRRVIEVDPAPSTAYRIEFMGYANIDEPALTSSPLPTIEDQVLISGGMADAFNFVAGKLVDVKADVVQVRSALDVAQRHEHMFQERKEQLRGRDQRDMPQPRIQLITRRSEYSRRPRDIITAYDEVWRRY